MNERWKDREAETERSYQFAYKSPLFDLESVLDYLEDRGIEEDDRVLMKTERGGKTQELTYRQARERAETANPLFFSANNREINLQWINCERMYQDKDQPYNLIVKFKEGTNFGEIEDMYTAISGEERGLTDAVSHNIKDRLSAEEDPGV